MSSTAILDSFLKKVNVDDTVVSEIIKATGLETIADFASAFTEANFEKELEVLCKAAGGDLLQTSRLRTAWRLSRTELDKACAGRIGIAVEDDWDAPLSDEVEIHGPRTSMLPTVAYRSIRSRHQPRRSLAVSFASSPSAR